MDVTIDGPFEKGHFTPEKLGRKYSNKKVSDFRLSTLYFSQGKYYDKVFVTFTFAGKEDPNCKMKVSLTVYGDEDKVIGRAESLFGDPRIKAKELNSPEKRDGMSIVDPVSSLSVRLKDEKKLSHISRIGISVVEIN